MTARPVIHDTFTIERTYPAPPARVFAAFTSAEAKNIWNDTGDLEPADGEAGIKEFDFRAGGRERFGFKMNGTNYRYDAATTTSCRTSGSSTPTRCTPATRGSRCRWPPSSSPATATAPR